MRELKRLTPFTVFVSETTLLIAAFATPMHPTRVVNTDMYKSREQSVPLNRL